jgi:hypothetical protein
VNERWPQLSDSLLLMCQLTRLEATQLRARCALALARARPAERKSLLRAVEQDAQRILKERMPWSEPWALLLRAGVAATQGDAARAATLLRDAAAGFDAGHMALYAAAARWQRGRIVGGDEGRALVADAEQWMGEQSIANKAKMAAMHAPGFDEG